MSTQCRNVWASASAAPEAPTPIDPYGDLKLIIEGTSEKYDVGDYGSLTYTFAWN